MGKVLYSTGLRGRKRMAAAQAMAGCLSCSIPTHWRYSSWLTVCLLFIPTPRCSRSALAATAAHPVLPAPATSQTDGAAAASRSSGRFRRGPAPGRPCCTAQPVSASPDPLPVPRIHPAGPGRPSGYQSGSLGLT